MKSVLWSAIAGLMCLSACASVPLPQQTLSRLDPNDVSYDSEACLQARNIAMTYEDKHITRLLLGTELGTQSGVSLIAATQVAGPASWGLGLYSLATGSMFYSIENNQRTKQEAVVAEIYRRCQSGVKKSAYNTPYRGGKGGYVHGQPLNINGVVYTPYADGAPR